ncbi:MAG: phosphatase PAP2 family protein [Clostridia bacterium]|nr:phosphatase PAP2 family protein [Clostridia bacterium]
MEFSILYAINAMHNNILDNIMKLITILGDAGIIWLLIALILILKTKTRKCGILIVIALFLGLLIGNLLLKNIIARPRPFIVDKTINLLIKIPEDYSFPSCHTMASFEAAIIIFLHNKKWGISAIILAILIGFSRIYLFVHYPSDVVFGAILGSLISIVVFYGENKYRKIRFS